MDDHERPLKKRGERAARLMGAHLRQAGLVPEQVLCSTARRTRDTLEGLALPDELPRRFEPELYLATPGRMLDRLETVEASCRSLLLIAHNPGTAQLAAWLTGSGDPAAAQRMATKYPTAGLAVLEFDGADASEAGDRSGWALQPGSGRLVSFTCPRDLE